MEGGLFNKSGCVNVIYIAILHIFSPTMQTSEKITCDFLTDLFSQKMTYCNSRE